MIIDWKSLIFFSTGFAVIALLDALRSLRAADKREVRTFTLNVIGYLIVFQFMIDVLPNTYFPIFVIIAGGINFLIFLLVAFYKNKIDVRVKPLLKNSKRTILTVVLWAIGVLLAYFKLYLAWWILVIVVLIWICIKVVKDYVKTNPAFKSDTDEQTNDPKKDKITDKKI